MNAEQKAKLQGKMARPSTNLPEESVDSNINGDASRYILELFKTLPRPTGLGPEVSVWQVIGDSSGTIFHPSQDRDIYYTWICAKILSPLDRASNRRFAVGIQWTGKEIDNDYHRVITDRLTRAVGCFTDLAEEFLEGGPLPMPVVGIPLLDKNRPVRVTGIWLRYDGVLIERVKGWYKVISEPLPNRLSHIVEPSGILKATFNGE